jgi:hypothetical protein
MTPKQRRLLRQRENRLTHFVNRESEMNSFQELLNDQDSFALLVLGENGMGKSSLLAKMEQQCVQQELRKAELVWSSTQSHDYMSVMRHIRDQVGKDAFTEFTKLVNFYTDPDYEQKIDVTLNVQGDIDVGNKASIKDSTIEKIAGVSIDKMVVQPRADMDVPIEEMRWKLTEKFIAGLAQVVTDKPLIVFLDAIEEMSPDTCNWLWDDVLGAVENIKFVMFGEQEPAVAADCKWQELTDVARLQPLNQEYIKDYLIKRGIDTISCARLLPVIVEKTKGKVDEVAVMVDKYLLFQQQKQQQLQAAN